MSPIHTILCPTDFSPQSKYAFELASALARDYGARLIVLHVVEVLPVVYGEGLIPPDPAELRAAGRAQLDELQPPQENVRAERRLEQGDSVEEVLRVSKEVNADLIVLGTHGRTGLGRLLMGSTAEQIVRKATCPVLTVKTPVPQTVVEESRQPVVAPAGP